MVETTVTLKLYKTPSTSPVYSDKTTVLGNPGSHDPTSTLTRLNGA